LTYAVLVIEMNILRVTTEREVAAELKLLRQLRETMQREVGLT